MGEEDDKIPSAALAVLEVKSELQSLRQLIEDKVIQEVTNIKGEIWPGAGKDSLVARVKASEVLSGRICKVLNLDEGGLTLAAEVELMKRDNANMKRFVWKMFGSLVTGGTLTGGGLLSYFSM